MFVYICTPDCIGADKGSIAQLVQSICLTSRGSAVRTRVLPQTTVQVLLDRCCFYTIIFFWSASFELSSATVLLFAPRFAPSSQTLSAAIKAISHRLNLSSALFVWVFIGLFHPPEAGWLEQGVMRSVSIVVSPAWGGLVFCSAIDCVLLLLFHPPEAGWLEQGVMRFVSIIVSPAWGRLGLSVARNNTLTCLEELRFENAMMNYDVVRCCLACRHLKSH